MKKTVILCALLCGIVNAISAQRIELKGLVREAQNNEALAFVNIVLQTPDSVFVMGAVSDNSGKFVIPNVNPGDYQLAFSYIGYVTQYIALEGLKTSIIIPDILMEEEVVGLDAVTVTASAITSRIDRKLIFPTERQVQVSNNGIDLLQQLMLPRLQINPLTRAVGVVGGGEVQLRINGVKVESADFVALHPKDVIRVEYHDNPGLRYGNAEAVIDYIVRRPETGGNLSIDIRNGFKLKQWGNYLVNGKINHKKSEFSVSYYANRHDYKVWRDNEESFTFLDGSTLRRKEVGEPDRFQVLWSSLKTNYSYQSDKRMFNAAFFYYSEDQPHSDYKGNLYNIENPEDYVQVIDQNKNYTSRPTLDLYYQENLENNQTLTFNLVGTYSHTDNLRIYQEKRENTPLTDIRNSVLGNRYSWIGEGNYEKKLDNNRLSFGLRHIQVYSDNMYKNSNEYKTGMQQDESYLYGEWKGNIRKLDYTLGVGITRSSFWQKNEETSENYTFNPRLALFYPLARQSSLRLTAGINNNMPSLSNLNAVEQMVDSFQIQRGNPGLKPFLRYQSGLNYEWKKGIFSANLRGTYEYQSSPIMDEKFMESDRIIQTWNNQKSWQQMSTSIDIRIAPMENIQLSFTGGFNHYISHGNAYRHIYNNPFISATLMGNYKNFQAMFFMNTNWNRFYGETLTGGENIQLLSLSYKYKDINFGAGVFSPFSNDYHVDMENWSEYASYRKRSYNNAIARYVIFQISYNFSFGRAFQSGQKRLNNADEDAGVMKSGK
jgi:hypothetical protein